MKRYKWEFVWCIGTGVFSFGIYSLHYYVFKDIKYIGEDLISQLAYLPIYVFLTTVVIDRFTSRREKLENLRRLNTVIGIFFNEIGKELIIYLTKFDLNFHNIKQLFNVRQWDDEKSRYAKYMLSKYECKIDSRKENVEELSKYIHDHRDFLVNLMGNPNLMEHESFTEMLIALFHLGEELKCREEHPVFTEEDYIHLSGDIERVYYLLIYEWIAYMRHLKEDYPFLYSFALRTNPFSQ